MLYRGLFRLRRKSSEKLRSASHFHCPARNRRNLGADFDAENDAENVSSIKYPLLFEICQQSCIDR